MTEQSHQARTALVQRFVELVTRSEVHELVALLAPSATYHVEGAVFPSGTFSTPEEIVNHVLALGEATKGTFEVTKWDDLLVGEYHAACIAQVRMQSQGRRFSGRVLYLLTFDGSDRIERIAVFIEDPNKIARFFNG